ncbi:MAG: ABC transporter ATP-binding protein [Acidimicrobiales bacterium]|nr:MAG: ABC transporter ATP-binding protein [Acidimicrobiales bacterium]
MPDAVLEAIDIDVRFGGLQALSSAGVTADAGTITGLIGPNGAGKTTLFNVITGHQHANAGDVRLLGRSVAKYGVHRRAQLGLSRTFQKLEAFNSLSARDNVLVAAEMHSGVRAAARQSDEILERVGLAEVADITVGTLPTGTARLVELARALAARPRALLLDEASSGLTEEETAAVGSLLKQLVDEDGLAVLLVEHDMSFVMNTCSHIHVLDFGQIIAVGSADEIQNDPAVRSAYLGTGS